MFLTVTGGLSLQPGDVYDSITLEAYYPPGYVPQAGTLALPSYRGVYNAGVWGVQIPAEGSRELAPNVTFVLTLTRQGRSSAVTWQALVFDTGAAQYDLSSRVSGPGTLGVGSNPGSGSSGPGPTDPTLSALAARVAALETAGYLEAEGVRDLMGLTLLSGGNIAVTPNDAGDTITLTVPSSIGGATGATGAVGATGATGATGAVGARGRGVVLPNFPVQEGWVIVAREAADDDYVLEDPDGLLSGGLPAGGSTGQALVKASNAPRDVVWGNVAGGSDPALTARVAALEQQINSLDTVPPAVGLASSSANVTTASSITLTAAPTDNIAVSKVEFYRASTLLTTRLAAPWTHTVALTHSDNGTAAFTARAFDSRTPTANNIVSNQVSVAVSIPGTTTFSAGFTLSGYDQTVFATFSGEDPSAEVVSGIYNWGDGTTSGVSFSVDSHVYSVLGNYLITQTIENAVGAQSGFSQSIIVPVPVNILSMENFTDSNYTSAFGTPQPYQAEFYRGWSHNLATGSLESDILNETDKTRAYVLFALVVIPDGGARLQFQLTDLTVGLEPRFQLVVSRNAAMNDLAYQDTFDAGKYTSPALSAGTYWITLHVQGVAGNRARLDNISLIAP